MFFDRSFFFLKEFCKPLSKEHFRKIIMIYQISGLGGDFKSFLLWLPWQPEFVMEHNYLKEFERALPKDIPVKFGKNPVYSF